MLDGGGAEPLADFADQTIALVPVVVVDPDLDQFVAVEANANFLQNGFSEPVLADRYDGVQAVRPGTQRTPLVGSDFKHL